ncbi:MAG: hypothetical protein HQM08_30745 [Candidatus Riflebacteria bacterium]|nr:hypothetical protein [Candidatus Riflebacteria bacterium]
MKKAIFVTTLFSLIFFLIPTIGICGEPTKVGNVTKWSDVARPEGHIAFEIAVARGNVEEVKEFLQQGADPNFIGWGGSSMIDITAGNTGNKTILKMFLKAGTNPSLRDLQGRLAVTKAVQNLDADIEFMKMLLDVTIGLNKEDVENVRNELKRYEELKLYPFTPAIPVQKIKLVWEKLFMLENKLPKSN